MTSKEQFRSLFAKHEPEILRFLDGVIEEFGRDISNLKIFCEVGDAAKGKENGTDSGMGSKADVEKSS